MWTVGPQATVEVLQWSKSQPPALSLSLDPGDVLIPAPLKQQDRVTFADFLLDLAEAATKLAEQLDPDSATAEPDNIHVGQHVLIRDESGDAGAGHL
jgi:hypothetical protein